MLTGTIPVTECGLTVHLSITAQTARATVSNFAVIGKVSPKEMQC